MLDTEEVWANVPSAEHEDNELATEAMREQLHAQAVKFDAKLYVKSHDARELGKRLIAERAASERGPLSSRVHNRRSLRDLPKPRHLIPHVLYTGAVAVMLGDSTVGKTWVALSLAAAGVSGTHWPTPSTGQPRPDPYGVLYIAAEDGGSIDGRLEHWENTHGINLDDAPITVHAGPMNLLDEVVVEEVAAFVREEGIRIVIVDTVSASFGGEEEGNPQFARLISLMRLITAAMDSHGGGCVLLVHHFGKDKDRGGRGGNALFADADIVWELGGDINNIEMKCTKWKADEFRRPWRLHLNRADREAVHIAPQQAPTSMSTDAPPDEFAIMTMEIQRVCRELADQNQGYGPNTRTIIGTIRERGGRWQTGRITEHLAAMAANGRLLTRPGGNRQTFHRLPPVQDELPQSEAGNTRETLD